MTMSRAPFLCSFFSTTFLLPFFSAFLSAFSFYFLLARFLSRLFHFRFSSCFIFRHRHYSFTSRWFVTDNKLFSGGRPTFRGRACSRNKTRLLRTVEQLLLLLASHENSASLFAWLFASLCVSELKRHVFALRIHNREFCRCNKRSK